MDNSTVLKDFEKSLKQLEKALKVSADSDLIRAGCIQYFEFCFELAWKSIQAAARAQGMQDCQSPKSCLRQVFANGWIKDEHIWLQMLEARNKMSHTYDTSEALKVYDSLASFLPELEILSTSLANC